MVLAGCSTGPKGPPSATVTKYKEWLGQYQVAMSSFTTHSQAVDYLKTSADCAELRTLADAGVLLPATANSNADGAWQAAMSALSDGVYTCATGTNFRDAAAVTKAADIFSGVDDNLRIVRANLPGS